MVVNVFVVSPDTRSERRIDPHITVEQLKVGAFFLFANSELHLDNSKMIYRES